MADALENRHPGGRHEGGGDPLGDVDGSRRVVPSPEQLDRARDGAEGVGVGRRAFLSDRPHEDPAHHPARRPVIGRAVVLTSALEVGMGHETATLKTADQAVAEGGARTGAAERGGGEQRCPREKEPSEVFGVSSGQLRRHAPAEGVTDHHDGAAETREHPCYRLGVLDGAPRLFRWRTGPEARQVKGDGGDGTWRGNLAGARKSSRVAEHASKVAVVSPPSVEGDHPRRAGAVDLAEHPAAVERRQHACTLPVAGACLREGPTAAQLAGTVRLVTPRRHHDADLLAGCDRQQVEAITTTARPLCVLAGAGSGKTRVLTRRIAWQVREGTALPSHVLTLTFTRKAAAELRSRLSSLGLTEGVTAGTFHAVALSELRRLAIERGEAPPAVLSSKARVLSSVLAQVAQPERRRGRQSTEPSSVYELAAEIEWAKSRLVTPERYPSEATHAGREPPFSLATVAELFDAYERERRKRRVLDFEDLLSVCASAVLSDASFAESTRFRFRHLFVDEYQDVNAAQLRLLTAWCGSNDDLCVVGDPDQAIYGWNGSDPQAIHRFARDFPGASVLSLTTNYRSTVEVVAVAAAVRGGEASPVGGPVPEGAVPTLTAYRSDHEEAVSVADAVRLAHRPGRTWSQIAILCRTNAQLQPFRRACEERGIPARVLGDDDFLRRPHVVAALGELERARGGEQLAALAGDLLDPPDVEEDAEDVRADLVHLATLVEEYVAADALASGGGFTAFLQANRRELGESVREAVQILTFHRAKGLEWPVVFVTGLEEGLVPISHAVDDEALAEERRLLYVACSRAAEELHCSFVRERHFGRERPVAREPSRFVAAIDRTRTFLAAERQTGREVALAALRTSRRLLAESDQTP